VTLRRKLAWISVLYFAEALPFGIAYDVWPVYFRVHGVSLREIGLMSLLSLPWTWKFLWAPLVDRFGARQHWITVLTRLALDLGFSTFVLWGAPTTPRLRMFIEDIAPAVKARVEEARVVSRES
jgi:PAT family beta-lactamase induction signal transducer AmpG